MKLYSYFRSSASYRVRIALHLKQLPFDYVPVHLLRDGGQQLKDEYRALSPDSLVPTLVDGDAALQQSLAIVEYLDETHPEPPLLPKAPLDRAYVRSIALQIACEIHPLNNLRVLKYLKHMLQVPEEAKNDWYRHWIEAGFATLEARLANDPRTGKLCFGDTPTLADICVVPQVFNANRFAIDTSRFPTIQRIYDYAMTLDAFKAAAPGAQPDAE
ncbi:maleylacetoacetate isomerase [Burkholderia ubonensis]|uniref:Maleylacetoacetate isomerase n=1 Tax=Burkholderia ubonensis TaxID=101571 RepID=A0ABD4EAF7_9BURK|nr:maleylacetoacetate isomerase [Burkholderia ubonensis]KVM11241.1 maleylacetoacetate isomerase [Burkholderia ubonensis]KVM14680.1 maleylacetoacetate isomerase [Burkholderia ubonensis]KVM50450.1 maleylacetoacetate isomerase [Burkholderia ubonensis]KVN87858.1 maleylacetoacetate isomerase [Burkholderia ubonensis]KVN93025.1 maleylacetoacetate isomerase [Burkholderia ubonensis]